MDTASHGVILFALGTNIKSSDFTPEKKEAVINTFRKLKQTILWKFETNITNLPENVIVRKWLPQMDILGKQLHFFLWHCNPGWVLALTIIFFHSNLSSVFLLQLLTFFVFKSLVKSSNRLFLGLHFFFVPRRFQFVIFFCDSAIIHTINVSQPS